MKGTLEYGNIVQGKKESYDEIYYNGDTIRREVVEASSVRKLLAEIHRSRAYPR